MRLLSWFASSSRSSVCLVHTVRKAGSLVCIISCGAYSELPGINNSTAILPCQRQPHPVSHHSCGRSPGLSQTSSTLSTSGPSRAVAEERSPVSLISGPCLPGIRVHALKVALRPDLGLGEVEVPSEPSVVRRCVWGGDEAIHRSIARGSTKRTILHLWLRFVSTFHCHCGCCADRCIC